MHALNCTALSNSKSNIVPKFIKSLKFLNIRRRSLKLSHNSRYSYSIVTFDVTCYYNIFEDEEVAQAVINLYRQDHHRCIKMCENNYDTFLGKGMHFFLKYLIKVV